MAFNACTPARKPERVQLYPYQFTLHQSFEDINKALKQAGIPIRRLDSDRNKNYTTYFFFKDGNDFNYLVNFYFFEDKLEAFRVGYSSNTLPRDQFDKAIAQHVFPDLKDIQPSLACDTVSTMYLENMNSFTVTVQTRESQKVTNIADLVHK